MLTDLQVRDVGPSPHMDLRLQPRLNLLTGDNGLGKSFILDVAWWALTRTWVDQVALPKPTRSGEISSSIQGTGLEAPFRGKLINLSDRAKFDATTQTWAGDRENHVPLKLPSSEHAQTRAPWTWLCPIIYARLDLGFSVFDPARNYTMDQGEHRWGTLLTPRPFHMTNEQVMHGLQESGAPPLCNGLVRDWPEWQSDAHGGESSPFLALCKLLEILSPPGEPIRPARSRRIHVNDARRHPTLQVAYDDSLPFVHASAGLQRIARLAYMLVWAWTSHVENCHLFGWEPARELIFLMDEVETHLHPRWQRCIVPALLQGLSGLSMGGAPLSVQMVLTTHSPLVLASLEPLFDEAQDRLFHFSLEGDHVALDVLPWSKQGGVDDWLTSEVFGLRQARSKPAEDVIRDAEEFLLVFAELPPEARRQRAIALEERLHQHLAEHDPFWARWGRTAEGA